MAEPLVCFVGCGSICASHAKRLQGRVRMKFLSRSESSATTMNARLGGEGVYATFDSILEDENVDALIVTSPPIVHAEQVIGGLEAGKAVFVEKPLCLDRSELEAVGRVRTDRLMVAENYDFKPSLHTLLSWIDSGKIGNLERVRLRKCTKQAGEGWRSAHGALLEGGIHFVALMTSLVRSDTVDVQAEFPGLVDRQPERHTSLEVTFGNGVTGELVYAWDTPSLTRGTFQHSEIVGSEGRIVFESNGIYAMCLGRQHALKVPGLSDLMGYGAMMDAFLRLLQGEPSSSGYAKASQDLGIVMSAYEQLPE